MGEIEQLQQEIAAWADQVVPNRTSLSIIAKMLEEMAELVASPKMGDPFEIADVAILMLDLCHIQGVDLESAVKAKMEINRRRNWNVSDNGRAQHA